MRYDRYDEALSHLKGIDEAKTIFCEGIIYEKKGDHNKALQKYVIASMRGFVTAYKFAANGFATLYNDSQTAVRYLTRGAKENDIECMLALYKLMPHLTPHTPEEQEKGLLMSLKLIRDAAFLNSMEACLEFVSLFLRGFHRLMKEEEVRDRLEFAVRSGNEQAILALGAQKLLGSMLYLPNAPEGIALLERLQNSGTANHVLATHYKKAGDAERARYWLERGAERSHPQCLYRLFKLTQDRAYLHRAADANHPKALYKKALLTDNYDEKYSLLTRSVAHKHLKAAYRLGVLLSSDPQNKEQVTMLLTNAGAKYPNSYYHLYRFLQLCNDPESALAALRLGAHGCDLDCLKALHQYKLQTSRNREKIEALLYRIRTREPDYMRPIDDVEQRDI